MVAQALVHSWKLVHLTSLRPSTQVSIGVVQGQIFLKNSSSPANVAFCKSSAKAQAHCDEYFAEDEEFFKKIWPWTTPIETCVDGRKDVKCTSFQEWTNAWATIKG